MPSFSKQSEAMLALAHPDLQRVLRRAIKTFDFTILCTLRSKEQQEKEYAEGDSKTQWPNSKHNRSKNADGTYNNSLSDAVDIMPYPVLWPDPTKQSNREYSRRLGQIYRLCGVIQQASFEESVAILWGGDFPVLRNTTFFDGPHFERVVK